MYVGDNNSENSPANSRSLPPMPPGNSPAARCGVTPASPRTAIDHDQRAPGRLGVGHDPDPGAVTSNSSPKGSNGSSLTNVQTVNDNSWIQDEGRAAATPRRRPASRAPGRGGPLQGQIGRRGGLRQRDHVLGARANSGYAEGNEGSSRRPTTCLSEMGEEPSTPEAGITLDPGGSNHAPDAHSSRSRRTRPRRLRRSPSTPRPPKTPDGSIAKYEWDLDGDGTFKTTTERRRRAARGATRPRAPTACGCGSPRATAGPTDLAVETLTIINNQPPTGRASPSALKARSRTKR